MKRKTEITTLNVDCAPKISEAEQRLQQAIQKNEIILRSKTVMDFLTYINVEDKIREDARVLFPENPIPKLVTKENIDDHILILFGSLSFGGIEECRDVDLLNANSTSSVMNAFQSPFNEIFNIKCDDKGEIWVSGKRPQLYRIDSTGKILKIIDVYFDALAFTFDAQGNAFFSSYSDVYRIEDTERKNHIKVNNWHFKGLCFTRNGDLLASMRTTGLKKSKITRFSGVEEVQRIQYDSKYNSYLSTNNNNVLFLTTSTDGDICVADWAGEAVVVFNELGDLRFRYHGNVSEETKLKTFKPYDIATDVNQNMLVTDTENNIIHVIDRDGNLIRHIEHLSVGPLCIYSQENLVIGDIKTGLVQIIKYHA